MALVYRHATRALECDRCRQKSRPADIVELESHGWQERGFAYHLCPACSGDGRPSSDAALERPQRRVA
ncbi:MAG: hypothetical protein ACJ77M_08595 [Thermoleophilaceae bacterium]|jgi:hypothetical protein